MTTSAEIVDGIQRELTVLNDLRDNTLRLSRELTRACAHTIRAVHRHEWTEAESLLAGARGQAARMVEPLAAQPTLLHAGYTQDALKELVEAHLVLAAARGADLPTPQGLGVTGATYLNGMCEAASEMRRFVLDLVRRGQVAEAEPYLTFMDEVYSLLIAVDFPDAVTDGLRRNTDMLRGVLEKTRGDLTMAIRQEQMRVSLAEFEARLDRGLAPQSGEPG